jgi:hypothetical protein
MARPETSEDTKKSIQTYLRNHAKTLEEFLKGESPLKSLSLDLIKQNVFGSPRTEKEEELFNKALKSLEDEEAIRKENRFLTFYVPKTVVVNMGEASKPEKEIRQEVEDRYKNVFDKSYSYSIILLLVALFATIYITAQTQSPVAALFIPALLFVVGGVIVYRVVASLYSYWEYYTRVTKFSFSIREHLGSALSKVTADPVGTLAPAGSALIGGLVSVAILFMLGYSNLEGMFMVFFAAFSSVLILFGHYKK